MIATHSLAPLALPDGIRSRRLDNGNGLNVHVLEAGDPDRPMVLLLHGFPELAYSWRKVMPALAEAGYYAVAPDQRGYGRTTGWGAEYGAALGAYRMLNLVRDALGLVAALGRQRQGLRAVVGHDFGSPVAAYCALLRPDVFRSVVLMSAPFAGPPPLWPESGSGRVGDIHAELAALRPPRKHYQWYYSGRAAAADMRDCRQGIHAFLRVYYHVKSADWPGNKPYRLAGWSAVELAKMPHYYIMPYPLNMAEAVAPYMPGRAEIAACAWLPDDQLRVYSDEFARTGFQGGLQWYRCATSGYFNAELQTFSGLTINVPALFIAGRQDWGVYQKPGDLERMQNEVCRDFRGCYLVDGAGHWVQQERPAEVSALLLDFLPYQGG